MTNKHMRTLWLNNFHKHTGGNEKMLHGSEKKPSTHMTLILYTPYINISIYAGSPNATVRRRDATPNTSCMGQ
jgi:hypothetical protein